MRTVVIASNNAHKADEIAAALEFDDWEFKTLREANIVSSPVEDADSFEGNARIKARAAWEACRTDEMGAGEPVAVLADDSGLEVDALGGAPGVYSSRYAGTDGDDEANNAKLLAELKDCALEERTARFVCTLVFVDEDGSEMVARGTIEGRIGLEAHGENGFGYDPLFYPDEFGGTISLAEVSQQQKNAISHRGNALRDLREQLVARLP